LEQLPSASKGRGSEPKLVRKTINLCVHFPDQINPDEPEMRPLTINQDEARGMLSSLVASKSFENNKLRLKDSELVPLKKVLPWLSKENPWFAAYRSSLRDVQKCADLCERICAEGRLIPNVPAAFQSASGVNPEDLLGEEDISVLQPVDDMKSLPGTYRHLRARAEVVFRSSLKDRLPPEWVNTHISELEDNDGKHIQNVPLPFQQFGSFTQVTFKDCHLDAKAFVQQHPYGTGSFRSTLDCVTNRPLFRLARFWSLDGTC
jgi:hypothetical protein